MSLQQVRADLFDFIVSDQSEKQIDNTIPVKQDSQSVENQMPTPDEVYNKRRGNKC